LASIRIASTGQAVMHHASAHCVQVYGTFRPACSKLNTLIRDFEMLNTPWFSYEHAISHCRQPVHLLGSMCNDFCISNLLYDFNFLGMNPAPAN
jgi:hypothetical protein